MDLRSSPAKRRCLSSGKLRSWDLMSRWCSATLSSLRVRLDDSDFGESVHPALKLSMKWSIHANVLQGLFKELYRDSNQIDGVGVDVAKLQVALTWLE